MGPQSLNSILSSNDPSAIPLTDFAAASSMPYDTYIPEGEFKMSVHDVILQRAVF
jgi:hypothetical protein